MNALFDHMERSFEARFESRHQAQIDAEEARAEEIEARAAAIYRDTALTESGHVCPKAMDEAIGDLCCRPAVLAELARLKDQCKTEAIGMRVSEWFDAYWDRRCRELAEDQIDAENVRAAEDAAAERWLEQEVR